MLLTENHILRLVLFTVVLLFSCTSPATAHVEKGTMPDSVAEMEYRILLEFEPDNSEVRIQLGMILFRSEKYKEAANEFNYVLDKNPEHVEALISLARVNIKLLNYQQAITILQKAQPLNPEDMHIYYFLGQALEMQGNVSEAEKVYRKGLSQKIPSQNKHAVEERQLLVEALKNLQERQEKALVNN